MKKTLFTLALAAFLFTFTLDVSAQGMNKYTRGTNYIHYNEQIHAVDSSSPSNTKVQIIGFTPGTSEYNLLSSLKEGSSHQLDILRLLSAPNVITRSTADKETWVYHWIWSYENEQDPNSAYISMDKPGKRIHRNKKPVSLVLTFNKQDILENYSLKYLKVKKDRFNEF